MGGTHPEPVTSTPSVGRASGPGHAGRAGRARIEVSTSHARRRGTSTMTDQGGGASAVERTLGTLATLNPAYAVDHQTPPPAGPITIDDLYRTHRMQMVRLAILLVDD